MTGFSSSGWKRNERVIRGFTCEIPISGRGGVRLSASSE